jgi:murein DD-endopeptidase MepM/ murein hydrolase activator NlpD
MSISDEAARRLAQMAHLIQEHPRRLAALVGTCLLVGGSGAFAGASLGPDPSDLPVQIVLQDIEPLTAQMPPEALEAQQFHTFRLYRTETVRSSDTANTLLQRLGVNDPAAAVFLRNDNAVRKNLLDKAGRQVQAETDNDNQLLKLTARWVQDDSSMFQRLVAEKTPAGWRSRIELAPLVASSRLASATIRTSLFAATDDANIPDGVASQLAEVFSSDIDFRRALKKGDRLAVVYETLEADGEPLRTGKVLSAEFVNAGKTHQAVWFQDGDKKGSYYTLDGRSMGRAFLSSPMEFSRVTSGFSMRMHPILQRWRAHLGTDYAAPTGTAVRSVGDGKVEFAGVQNGFGNVVFINHGNNHVTVYAHLSAINVTQGQTVSQGQHIGAVGQTGWATGSHLHFEFRVNGVHLDPEDLALQATATTPVSTASRPAFDKLAATMRMQLSAAALVQQASAQ